MAPRVRNLTNSVSHHDLSFGTIDGLQLVQGECKFLQSSHVTDFRDRTMTCVCRDPGVNIAQGDPTLAVSGSNPTLPVAECALADPSEPCEQRAECVVLEIFRQS